LSWEKNTEDEDAMEVMIYIKRFQVQILKKKKRNENLEIEKKVISHCAG